MKKYFLFFGEGSQINQIICAILINLPLLTYGMAIAWISPMTLLLQSDQSPIGRKLSDTEISWMASLPYLLAFPSAFLIAAVIDRWGRKVVLLKVSVIFIISWALLLVSSETWAFLVCRALMGVCTSACFIACPIYTKETSDSTIRGALGTLLILSVTVGNLIMYVLGDLLSYNVMLWSQLLLPTVHFLLFLAMPESPSYLLKRGRKQEATRALAWLRCRSEGDLAVTTEIDSLLREQNNDEQNDKFILKAIFQDANLRKAFWIGICVTFSREACGAIPVLNFAGYIFESASRTSALSLTPNQQAILMGVVQIIGCSIASSVVENAGRRPLLIVTSLVSGISMFALATWFVADVYGVAAPAWIPVTSLCLCIFCDAGGLQPVSIVVLNEIFSFKYRSTVTSIAMSGSSLVAAMQVFFFKPLATSVGTHVSFYFFGAVCLATSLYVYMMVPETKQRTVDEIYEDLGRKSKKSKKGGQC